MPAAREPPPILWLPMALPIGLGGGYVVVAVANDMGRAGLSTTVISQMIAFYFLSLTLGAVWGPLIDASLKRRTWVVLGTVLTATGLLALTLLPRTPAKSMALVAYAFASGTGAIIVGLASKGIAAHSMPMHKRTRAGAWYAAGNLGVGSAGGAVGVWLLASDIARPIVALLVFGAVLLTLIAVPGLPSEMSQPLRGTIVRLGSSVAEVWQMLWTPKGGVALLISLTPFGTGAALNLMSGVAVNWHAGPAVVSSSVALSSPVSAIAALVGGSLAVRVGPWLAYTGLGIMMIAVGILAAFLPHTAVVFFATIMAYACVQGAIFSAFYAVVFDTADQGAASTKMGALLSLSNLPFSYESLLEGQAVERWGVSGLLLSDAALGCLGLVVVAWLASYVRVSLWRRDSGANVMKSPKAAPTGS